MGFMDGLVTEHDLAKQVGVSVFTLRVWRRKKYGPPSAKLGKSVVYRQLDIDAFMSSIFDQEVGGS
jgi:DNA-binding transcriptional MerR regulator